MQTDTVHVRFPARCDPRMAVKSFFLGRPLRNCNFHLLRRTLGGCATYHGGIVSFLTGHTGILWCGGEIQGESKPGGCVMNASAQGLH